MDLAAVALVLAFVGVVGRLYTPRIEWRAEWTSALKALVVAFVLFVVSSVTSLVIDGVNRDETWLTAMIPGAIHLPVLSILCFGVIEAFRGRVKEV